MATTKEDIKRWFERGVKIGATHVVIMCDTFDWEDYPVYIMPGEDARYKAETMNGPNMQQVMEVYNLSMPMEAQLNERRSFNY